MTGEAIRSPLHAVQERIGGTFDDWDGWLWTTGFAFGAIALAVVDLEAAGPGPIEVDAEAGPAGGRLGGAAIYDPEKRRPRS
jgi:hypothetical protein